MDVCLPDSVGRCALPELRSISFLATIVSITEMQETIPPLLDSVKCFLKPFCLVNVLAAVRREFPWKLDSEWIFLDEEM